MPQQISLFEMQEKTILTDKQRRTQAENPFFAFFAEATPESLVSESIKVGKYYFDEHPLLAAFYAAQTIALEKIYRELDARFLDVYEGAFQLTVASGEAQTIRFRFNPDYYVCEKRERTQTPKPHLEFTSEDASIISNTGFRSEFMDCLPFWKARTIEELIELKVREISGREDFKISFV